MNMCIVVDSHIHTDTQVRYYKSNIVIFDSIHKMIIIVKAGIISRDYLKNTEVKKLRKFVI